MEKATSKRSQPNADARTQIARNQAHTQPAQLNLSALRSSDILQLQRTIGNKAVQRLLVVPRPASAAPVVQRAWDTQLIDYTVMDNEKTQGQIKTSKLKIGSSINDWVKKFRKGLLEKKDKDALAGLTGLKTRLQSDQTTAAAGKLKKPKGAQNWVKATAQQAAAVFFQRWIGIVDEHLNYIAANGDWMTDFRQKYINDVIAAGKTDREMFLENAAQMYQADGEAMLGLGKMWDLGDHALRQRITVIMGGVSDLRRMSGLEYFLEQVSPVHVGYSKVREWFQFWTTGVLHYGWTKSWADFVVEKYQQNPHEEGLRVIDSYDAGVRAQYLLTPNGKNIMKANGQPLVGDNIYVLTSDDLLYGGSKDGPVHHSSFMQGAPVKCAGHLYTDPAGKLNRIDISSGHYAPTGADLERAMKVLAKQMDISEVQTGGFH